jgi:hypothetical protein
MDRVHRHGHPREGHYFAWGDFASATKRITCSSLTSVERFDMTRWRGKNRIWGAGTSNIGANDDPQRPEKSVGFFFHVGGRVVPFVNLDDPEAFERALRPYIPVVPSG